MHPALTYSLLALCATLFVFGFWVDARSDRPRWNAVARFSLALQLGAIGGAYLVLRPGRGVNGHTAIEAARASQQALLLDLYSNW